MVDYEEERKELIRFENKYYLISRVWNEGHNEWETMIFPADYRGEVTDYGGEVYEHRGYETVLDSALAFIGSDHDISDVEGDLD